MKLTCLVLLTAVLSASSAKGQGNIIQIQSHSDYATTLDALKSSITKKELHIFSIIDHKEGARKIAIELSPTTVIIFGSPKVGTALMNCDQRVGLELPLKIAVWENEKGVFLSYHDPHNLEKYYNLGDCSDVIDKVARTLNSIAISASK